MHASMMKSVGGTFTNATSNSADPVDTVFADTDDNGQTAEDDTDDFFVLAAVSARVQVHW